MKEVDDSFKGKEFYDGKTKELHQVLEDMETSDALVVFTSFMIDVVGNALKTNDLEDARTLINALRSKTLDCLAHNGWE